MNCQHCHRVYVSLVRGLCRPCWRDKGIREQYPMKHCRETRIDAAPEDISTEALEAMIAENYPTMPQDDHERKFSYMPDDLPRVVLLGLGIRSSYRREVR